MKEKAFVNNYAILGEGASKRYGFNKQDTKALKKKLKKEGEYMLPIKQVAESNAPTKTKKNNVYNGLSFALACLDEADQNEVIELAKNIPKPDILIDQAIAIQEYRIKMGLSSEYQQGRLLETTETAISNFINMIQAKQTISEGENINLNVSSTITSLLEEIEDDDDVYIDYDNQQSIHEEINNIIN